eukprot:gene1384-1597_t
MDSDSPDHTSESFAASLKLVKTLRSSIDKNNNSKKKKGQNKDNKTDEPVYDLVRLVAPRAHGALLKTTVYMCESGLLKFPELFAFQVDLPVTPYPNVHKMKVDSVQIQYPTYSIAEFLRDKTLASGELNAHKANPNSTIAFHRAYSEGKTDPLRVAKSFVSIYKESDKMSPPLGAFISVDNDDVITQATESAERWRNGTQLSILDGVPISIKDELDQAGHQTTCGTSFLGKIHGKAAKDSKVAADLRALGAVLVGKNNMHEIGISTLGYNTHFGFTRNPFNLQHYPGGSSSGSACSVSSGLNPISIGCDGGGSIRIPASLCGVVGLKATFGRVSHTGCFDLCYSVGHIGPLAQSVVDAAIGYAAIAGRDEDDHTGLIQPEPTIPNFAEITTDKPLQGLRIGVYREWFNDTTKEINDACNRSLALMEEQGATIVEISISHLLNIRLAQGAIIVTEMRNAMSKYFKDHLNDFHADTRITLSVMSKVTGYDYLQCNRVRTYAINQVKEIFKMCDVIVTPMNGALAPEILPSVLHTGESNLSEVGELMKFAFLGNLTGIPGISLPVGLGEKNLPIGLQIMGRWWEEDLLLHTAYVLEKAVQFNGAPAYFKPILENQVE